MIDPNVYTTLQTDVDRFANESDPEKGIIYDIPTDGIFQVYWPNDNLRYEWYYKNGKRADGVSKGWWENGNLKQVYNYENGQRNGLWTQWYEYGAGGEKGELEYNEGWWSEMSSNDKSQYIDTHSHFRKFLRDQMGEYYKKKKPSEKDIEIVIDMMRKRHKEQEGNFKDELQDGLWTSWLSNGQKEKEEIYTDNEIHIINYGPDGQLISEKTYTRGESK